MKPWILLLTLGTVFYLPARAGTENCPEPLSPILAAASEKPASTASIQAWGEFEKKTSVAVDAAARNVFESYLRGKWTEQEAEKASRCLQDLGMDLPNRFVYATSRSFFDGSVARLSSAQSTLLKAFAEAIRSAGFHVFKVFGQFQSSQDGPSDGGKGGFHRGSRSLFMDASRIPANEWLVIFIHEFAHSLDATLASAITVYSNPEAVRSFSPYLQSPASEVPPDVLADLDRWLMAGLDRGFLAECRAWSVTLSLYQEGIGEGMWSEISWMNAILSKRQSGESLPALSIRILNDGFSDPTDGLFVTPLISAELKRIRSDIDTSGKLPLGNLAPFVK